MNEQTRRRRSKRDTELSTQPGGSPEWTADAFRPAADPPQELSSGALSEEISHTFSEADHSALHYYSSVLSQKDYHAADDTLSAYDEESHDGNVYRRRTTASEESVVTGEYSTVSGTEQNCPKSKGGKILLWVFLAVFAIVAATVLLSELNKPDNGGTPSIEDEANGAAVEEKTPEILTYDAAPVYEASAKTMSAVEAITASISPEKACANENSLIMRSSLGDGLYDFYVFSADEGKLLCYFDHLKADEGFIQEDGNLYFAQSPFVICPDGSALLSDVFLKESYGEDSIMHPFYGEWAAVEENGEWTFANREGTQFSNIRYAKLYPFTGQYTIGYVDSGSSQDRYSLHVLATDGSDSVWLTAEDDRDVLLCCLGFVFMRNGDVYRLPDTDAPLFRSSSISVYPDFDAIVYRDEETGLFSMLVGGEYYVRSFYQSIEPLESNGLPWKNAEYTAENTSLTMRAIDPCCETRPVSYAFVMRNAEKTDYISLSAEHSYPLLRDFELEAIR